MHMVEAFLIGFIGSFIGSIATGANLINIPGLIFIGVSPITAIATTRLSAITGGGAIIYRYNKAKMVIWRYIPYFFLIAIAGGIIGPQLLLHIDQNVVKPIVGVLLITTLPLLFIDKKFGTQVSKTSTRRKLIGFPVLLVVMTYATMLTLGGGAFLAYALVYFYGMTVIEANATGTVIWSLAAVTALVAYISRGAVDFSLGIPLMIGAAGGGYLGARTAIEKGTAWVKWLLAGVVLASAIKLIFF